MTGRGGSDTRPARPLWLYEIGIENHVEINRARNQNQ